MPQFHFARAHLRFNRAEFQRPIRSILFFSVIILCEWMFLSISIKYKCAPSSGTHKQCEDSRELSIHTLSRQRAWVARHFFYTSTLWRCVLLSNVSHKTSKRWLMISKRIVWSNMSCKLIRSNSSVYVPNAIKRILIENYYFHLYTFSCFVFWFHFSFINDIFAGQTQMCEGTNPPDMICMYVIHGISSFETQSNKTEKERADIQFCNYSIDRNACHVFVCVLLCFFHTWPQSILIDMYNNN